MYPTIVILLINTQRSCAHIFGFITPTAEVKTGASPASAAGARHATVGHLSFATPGTQISGVTNISLVPSQSISVSSGSPSEKTRQITDEDTSRTTGGDGEKQTQTAPF